MDSYLTLQQVAVDLFKRFFYMNAFSDPVWMIHSWWVGNSCDIKVHSASTSPEISTWAPPKFIPVRKSLYDIWIRSRLLRQAGSSFGCYAGLCVFLPGHVPVALTGSESEAPPIISSQCYLNPPQGCSGAITAPSNYYGAIWTCTSDIKPTPQIMAGRSHLGRGFGSGVCYCHQFHPGPDPLSHLLILSHPLH